MRRLPYGGLRTGSLLAGLCGMFFVTIIGNLGNLKLLLDQFSQRGTVTLESSIPGFAKLVGAVSGLVNVVTNKATLDFPNDWWFWNASRVIPDTINEFPFFTFTYADLHAHMIALPITLLALTVVVSLCLCMHPVPQPGDGEPSPWAIPLRELAVIVLLGFVVGSLRATNTWDFPTYALAGLVALVVLEMSRRGPILAVGAARGHPGLAGLRAALGRIRAVALRHSFRRGRDCLLSLHEPLRDGLRRAGALQGRQDRDRRLPHALGLLHRTGRHLSRRRAGQRSAGRAVCRPGLRWSARHRGHDRCCPDGWAAAWRPRVADRTAASRTGCHTGPRP